MPLRPQLTPSRAVAGLALAGLVHERITASRRQAAADDLLHEHAALHDVAALVARGADLNELCAHVAQTAAGLLDGEVGLVLRFDGQRGILIGRWVRTLHAFPRTGEQFHFEPDSSIGRVLAHSRTVRVAPGTPSQFRNDLGERVASPIALGGRLWGAVAVAGTRAAPLPPRGEARLESFAELVSLAIGNAEARAQLEAQASTDPLTGVANRRAFQSRLDTEFARSLRYGRPVSLAVLDVDRFKTINDTAGHLAGDGVLVEIAHRLGAGLRGDALLGRLGGDEFAVLLPECDAATAREIVDRAVGAVSAEAIGALGRVTISAGIAEREPRDRRAEDLYQRADTGLYRAKHRRQSARLSVWTDSTAA